MPQISSSSDWKGRLNSQVDNLQRARSYREVTYNRLKELVDPPNDVDLLRAVSQMISTGQISVYYRIISPRRKVETEHYLSPLDIPDSILDQSTGEYFDIDPIQNVEVVYVSGADVAN